MKLLDLEESQLEVYFKMNKFFEFFGLKLIYIFKRKDASSYLSGNVLMEGSETAAHCN